MKKIILLFIISVLSVSIYGQSTDRLYSDGLELYKELNLTTEQSQKIRKINKEIGPKFAEIGRNKKLSGYEKGQKKRELAIKHKEEVRAILTQSQIKAWEQHHGQMSNEHGMKDSMTSHIDEQINRLEDEYDKKIDALESLVDTGKMSKDDMKAKKKALKTELKEKKAKLKTKKHNI